MTIAVGILATDGVVLAADTQHTYAGIAKIDAPKILVANRSGDGRSRLGGFAVSGAGWSDYLEAASQSLCARFLAMRLSVVNDIGAAAGVVLRRFYRDHVVPFGQFPDDDRPNLQLLIAAQSGGGQQLWIAGKNTLRRARQFAAVGSGEVYARMLLSRYAAEDMTVVQATALAAYAVFSAKQFVEGCGRETHVVQLCGGAATYYPKEKVDLLEDYFQKYFGAERNALRYALGLSPTDAETPETFYGYFRGLRFRVEELETFSVKGGGLSDYRVAQPEWKESARADASPPGQQVPQSTKRGRTRRPPSRA